MGRGKPALPFGVKQGTGWKSHHRRDACATGLLFVGAAGRVTVMVVPWP